MDTTGLDVGAREVRLQGGYPFQGAEPPGGIDIFIDGIAKKIYDNGSLDTA